ncbi:MAG: hypothetical protein QXK98_07480 [Candidatus Bathyarchaeia archaeon]
MSQTVDRQKTHREARAVEGILNTQTSSIQKFHERAMKIRFILGLVSLIVGLLADNMALFQWVERAGLYYLLGEYARYVCAYGGFLALICGAMLLNDYINHENILKRKRKLSATPLLMKPKKGSAPKRITCRRVGNLITVLVSVPFAALFFALLPITFSVVSYTATVSMIVKSMPIYYLHRTDLSGVTPAGKLMNITKPPASQSEILYVLVRGGTVYFYSPMLSEGSVQSGTWFLYLWASTVSDGEVSRLTVRIHIVSADGTVEKAAIGSVTDVVIGYGYSERIIAIAGSYANISSSDRIRLTLYAQTGSGNDPKGLSFYYDGYGTYQTLYHETRLEPP